ncbi:MAG: hypothetical protein OSB21_01585 [Myxococcota bacterium]|jgi:hypothetical protein|nr:hypothetical protein [Myxococcota bacterium]
MTSLLPLSLALQLLFASPAQVDGDTDQKLVDGILREVSALRGLKVLRTVPAVRHSRDQILAYVDSRIQEEYPGKALEREALMLKHLGLIPRQLDYRATLEDFVTAQVAGYFDPFKDRFVLASWLGNMMQRPIIAHELTHALQHQHFGLKKALKRIPENDDATIARSAIIEGDATITMVVHLMQTIDLTALQEAVDKMATNIANGPTLTARHVPYYMRQGLTFPYVGGLKLLMLGMHKKSFKGIDDLHRLVPQSTEQLLHPERYPNDHPIAVDFKLPVKTLGGFSVAARNRLGELGMRFLVSPLGEKNALAERLSDGWGGDRYAFLLRGKESALVAAVATDDAAAAKRYREILQTSFANRYSKAPKVALSGRAVSDGYLLQWQQKGRCLAWVEAPLGAPSQAWLKAAISGCSASK